MIIYNLRKPAETDAENCVGVTGENNSFTARFLIRELVDYNLSFSIHLRFADGSVNTVVPDEVNVDDTGTTIIWNVKKNDIFVHGFFEMQIEGRKSDGYVFQTEIVRMYADESIPVEDKEYENPNSETLKLREEAYDFLCELKIQQDRLDENMRLLLATDITTKADNSSLISVSEGLLLPSLYSKFVRAGVSAGTPNSEGSLNENVKYRVTSEDIMKFDYDLNVTVDDGFTAYVVKYVDGVYKSIKSLSDTNGYIIPAGTEFRLHIRRNPENISETADIDEFVNAVKFQTKIAYDVDNIRTELSETVQTTNESKQIISEDIRSITVLNRTETHTTNPFVCIAYEFKKGLSYTIEYNTSASVSKIVTTATNSISGSQMVETLATGDLQNGTIVFSPKSDGAKYLTFVGAEKGAEGEKTALTITGKITSSLLEKVKDVDTSVSEISNVITKNLYNETSLYNSRSTGGFVGFPFEFEVGKRYKITFSSDREVDYIYNQTADTINSSDKVEIIANPEVHGTIIYYTPTVAGGKYLVFKCAERKVEMWVDVNIEYSLIDMVDELGNQIENIKKNGTVDPIPDYYFKDEYLPNKIKEIKEACAVLHGVTFAFITDVHFKANQKQSKKLLRKVLDETNVPFVVFGGDIVYLLGTEEELYEQIAEFNDFKSCVGKDRLFCTRGNHDLYNATSADRLNRTEYKLTTPYVYDALFRDTEYLVSSMSVDNGCYCIDNKPQKTRIIMLNTSDMSDSIDYEGGGVSFRSETLKWLSAALTEKTNYKIIIVCHTPLNYETFTNDVNFGENRDGLSLMVQAFKNKTTFETTRFDTTVQADFTNTTNELVCVVSGHRHIDGSSVENNVLNIVTTCDCIDVKDGYGRKAGTISEQAFDVVSVDYDKKTVKLIRIGAGENREYNYCIDA